MNHLTCDSLCKDFYEHFAFKFSWFSPSNNPSINALSMEQNLPVFFPILIALLAVDAGDTIAGLSFAGLVKTIRATLPICGVNGTNTNSTIWTSFASFYSQYRKTIDFHVLLVITAPLPVQSVNITSWSFPKDVKVWQILDLMCPLKLTLLLGAKTFYELVRALPMGMPGGLPWLYETALGWIISGPIVANRQRNQTVLPMLSLVTTSAWMDTDKSRCKKNEDEMT
ncbi:Hypothetical protein CINCED_3A007807 [Cinara cedri]|uniref:Uncharacterized protein n=1 Tax=Cinara cedri TaxID=506608 RepID=A0A5E4MUN2_9HEMI|nr:Hypothetical protein CINCED_3A007807 [Cinara cedri]